MDYVLENLGPERFQQMCQALLVKEMRGVQCFPVAQPDGGRDALTYPTEGEFTIFQVKYNRRPQAERDPHKWLLKALEEDVSKVRGLLPRGVSQYIVITNVPGTGHLDAGSIDQADRLLAEELGIPARVWWRDDVNRRLDGALDVKWSYVEVMSGRDVLASLLHATRSDDDRRRDLAIRSFLRSQYTADQELRFKQIELESSLLDFFVDVPASVARRAHSRSADHLQWSLIQKGLWKAKETGYEGADIDEQGVYVRRPPAIGAATFLLDDEVQKQLPRLVLEGAPGQGKSTLAQYICQVHRARLLENSDAIARLPRDHQGAAVRLPIRAELRDLATWLTGSNPFARGGRVAEVLSLESFLAALVSVASGGTVFDVADLLAVAAESPILLVLDGFDEVPDMSVRRDLIADVDAGLARLAGSTPSLQVVVTSRPTAFANSPGFSSRNFAYFELVQLSDRLINEYAEKWILARNLNSSEAGEVREVLQERLRQPHLRDLARNPMQLAILLSLIHTHGVSLPDRRTELYDAYIERFFNREAAKSDIVRRNRGLLIEIHQFLAWHLHAEAETTSSTGRIAESDLQALLRDYLEERGHSRRLVDDLFTGIVERVVALVSRVQGTFEFEVQPLREYFAGRYLYETAPYSPAGSTIPGTLTERFRALSRDFYWLNVARFYAGCYSRGELASLADCLEELGEEPNYGRIVHPRLLASMLLKDWVFQREKRSIERVVRLMLRGAGLRLLLSETDRSVQLGIPDQCGRDNPEEHCLSELQADPPSDVAHALCGLLQMNRGPGQFERWWTTTRARRAQERTSWVMHGLLLGHLSELDGGQVNSLLDDDTDTGTRISALAMAGNRTAFIEDEHLSETYVKYMLDSGGAWQAGAEAPELGIAFLPTVFAPTTYVWAYRSEDDVHYPRAASLAETWRRFLPIRNVESIKQLVWPEGDAHERARRVVDVFDVQSRRPLSDWAEGLDPWNSVVEAARREWGERMAIRRLAMFAAAIRSASARPARAPLFDAAAPLVARTRYSRLQAGNDSWWNAQLDGADSADDAVFALALLLSYATERTLSRLAKRLATEVARLDDDRFADMAETVQVSLWCSTSMHRRSLPKMLRPKELPPSLSPRLAVALSPRVSPTSAGELYSRYVANYRGSDRVILQWAIEREAERLAVSENNWPAFLRRVSRLYESRVVDSPYSFSAAWRRRPPKSMPVKTAQRVIDQSHDYPLEVIDMAELVCRDQVARAIDPVGTTASRSGWFVADTPPQRART